MKLLTLLQFSHTTTLAKDPPKSTLTNGTNRLSSGISSNTCSGAAGAGAVNLADAASDSLPKWSICEVDLVGEDGAEGAGDGNGETMGDTPEFEGRLDPLRFLPFPLVTGGWGCRRFKTSFSSISILSNRCLNSS